MRTAILVDEMNLINQLHKMGIKGIKEWIQLYETIEKYFCLGKAEFNFYTANVPVEFNSDRHKLRSRFFHALERKGINVHEGFTVFDSSKQLVIKGVDILLSLDILEKSLDGFDEIIIVSATSSHLPTIERVKRKGTTVKVVVSEVAPAGKLVEACDETISLEEVIELLPPEQIKWLKYEKSKLRHLKENYIA